MPDERNEFIRSFRFEPELYEQLRQAAAKARRSINKEALHRIEQSLQQEAK
jgi:hypothetical protein